MKAQNPLWAFAILDGPLVLLGVVLCKPFTRQPSTKPVHVCGLKALPASLQKQSTGYFPSRLTQASTLESGTPGSMPGSLPFVDHVILASPSWLYLYI
jgi:hypothetical protein